MLQEEQEEELAGSTLAEEGLEEALTLAAVGLVEAREDSTLAEQERRQAEVGALRQLRRPEEDGELRRQLRRQALRIQSRWEMRLTGATK